VGNNSDRTTSKGGGENRVTSNPVVPCIKEEATQNAVGEKTDDGGEERENREPARKLRKKKETTSTILFNKELRKGLSRARAGGGFLANSLVKSRQMDILLQKRKDRATFL